MGCGAGLPLIVVMPDGENSWYTNSAGDPASRFEDYVLTDLANIVMKKLGSLNSSGARLYS